MKHVLEQIKPRLPGFIAALQQCNLDPRDPRGRRHDLVFVLAGTAIALICGCRTLSSIQRFLKTQHRRLVRLLGIPSRRPVSRGHLPRLLNVIEWDRLSALVTAHFGALQPTSWVAVDGKALRGSSPAGERQAMVFAVSHATRCEVAQARQAGLKCSEIPVVRQFLRDTGLECQRVSLDALHCNPGTLRQCAAGIPDGRGQGPRPGHVLDRAPVSLAGGCSLARHWNALSGGRCPRDDAHLRWAAHSGSALLRDQRAGPRPAPCAPASAVRRHSRALGGRVQ